MRKKNVKVIFNFLFFLVNELLLKYMHKELEREFVWTQKKKMKRIKEVLDYFNGDNNMKHCWIW